MLLIPSLGLPRWIPFEGVAPRAVVGDGSSMLDVGWKSSLWSDFAGAGLLSRYSV
jgi:hypothetical protein